MVDPHRLTVPFTWTYQAELNPLRAHLALLRAGLRPPVVTTACELGYGLGLSLAVHAAASPVAWYGTDLVPAHAATARRLAAASGAEVAIHDEPFARFCTRDDLPDFDFIGLHGVWSWISESDRAVLLRFVHDRLRPGGVLYLGYNALPGWAGFMAVRDLLVTHAASSGWPGSGSVDHVEHAMAFVGRLLATEPAMARANPQLQSMFAELERQGLGVVAHELFAPDWQPMSFATVARQLAPLGLAYASAADLSDIIDRLDMSVAQRRLVDGLADPVLGQLVRDCIFGKRFRRDYWVRDPQPLPAVERDEAIRQQRVVATAEVGALPLRLQAALALQPDGPDAGTVGAVLAQLANRRPLSLGDLESAAENASPVRLLDAVTFLAAHDLLGVAQDAATIAGVRPRTEGLNRHLREDATIEGEGRVRASPVTGGGVTLSIGERLLQALQAV